MKVSNIFILFIGSNLLLSSCSLSENNEKTSDEQLTNVCKNFIKAICTKDTIDFYKLVDKKILTNSMNQWINDSQMITEDEVYFPFFLIYSPLIPGKTQSIMTQCNNSNFFNEFKISKKKSVSSSEINVRIAWKVLTQEAEIQKIDLDLKKNRNNEWKVVGAKW